MLEFKFTGRWERVHEELHEHEEELGGREVVVNISETKSQYPPSGKQKTLGELFKGRIGTVPFDPPDLSEKCGEKFTEILEEKYREGSL